MPTPAVRLVADTLDLGGRRTVVAALPEADPTAVVFVADGAAAPGWAAALAQAGAPPTAVVGVHAVPDEQGRLAEYSPGFDPERFAAHERFFTETVPAWARERCGLDSPPDRTAVFGASAGGELALALGVRHPERYGAVLAASPGAGYRPDGLALGRVPRTCLVAGRQEPFFLDNARWWSTALAAAGVEVELVERDGEHGSALWRAAFPAMVAWAFRGRAPRGGRPTAPLPPR